MSEDTQADTGLVAALEAKAPGVAPTVTAAVTDPANPGNAPAAAEAPAAPSPPIQFAEPAAPVVKTVEQVLLERGLHPSQQVVAEAPAPEPERSIAVGDMRLVERGSEIVLESIANPTPVHQPAARNERQMTRLELELAAGQKRVQHHRQMQANRHLLAAKPTAAELAARSTNTPVFRPGNAIESGKHQGSTIFPQTHVFAGVGIQPPQE